VSFVGLYTGLTGIRAAQTGIDITGHNVANAATPGYTRQRVELEARPVYASPAGPVGTGVDVRSIARLRDSFLDDRARSATADHRFHAVRAETLTTLEDLSGEPDNGVSARLAQLWQAAESWANAPADLASRRAVLSELASVAETMQTTASSWDRLALDVDARLDTQLATLRDTLQELQTVDRRIASATDISRAGPDLADQRDLLLDRVAALTGGQARIDATGRAFVEVGGVVLLREGEVGELIRQGGTFFATPPVSGDGATAIEVRGELGGLAAALRDIRDQRAELDDFAQAFVTAINDVNARGGGPPLLGFGQDLPVGASSVRLATSDPGDLRAGLGDDAPPNDHRNARALADLRTEAVGGRTLEAHLADLIVHLAGEVRSARGAAASARAVASGAELARLSEHGVSIDEEMVALVRYQRSLEAASRVMTTVDEALDVLVNRTGVVGR
jgi:flagellar hook-associated protein 1 FlgK